LELEGQYSKAIEKYNGLIEENNQGGEDFAETTAAEVEDQTTTYIEPVFVHRREPNYVN
jgi:hypothetical protein